MLTNAPTLLVLNGPPGIGKSTIATRYLADHPLALSVEQDVVRGLLGLWRACETESGTLAREICVAMARTHLGSGHDVVVPQFVADRSYLDRLAGLAREVAARHAELVLVDEPGAAERRFHARMDDPLRADHQRVAASLVEEAGGYAHQYARLVRCLAGRSAVEVRSVEGDPEGTYRAVLDQL